MTQTRTLQDAGRERTLTSGEVYDLPDLVAESLLSLKLATRPRGRRLRPPETKPMRVPERKRAGRVDTTAAP